MSTSTVLEPTVPRSFEDEYLYEIIDGKKVEVLPMGALAGRLANRLAYRMNAHAIPNELGEANVENLFHLALPVDRNRRPDVAFVSKDRWPKDRPLTPEQNAWDVVPNIIVETISPSDFNDEILDKIDEYFRAGVELVWTVHPKQKLIYVYESPTSVRVLAENDILDGGRVLPQFQLPLKELFID
jgi:Uma2 family endonuclease